MPLARIAGLAAKWMPFLALAAMHCPISMAQTGSAGAQSQVGGADVLTLVRKPSAHGDRPEFRSATLLPGRGMNLFQLTASLPGHGEVRLLKSPSLSEAARVNLVLAYPAWLNPRLY